MRVLVVGSGNSARQHISVIEGTPGATMAGMLEPLVETADGWKVDHQAVLRRISAVDVDAIAFCTPPAGRVEMAIWAIESNKTVMLEKPPALSTTELAALLSAADSRGLPAAVMFQHRLRLSPTVFEAIDAPSATGSVEVFRRRDREYFLTGWRSRGDVAGGGIFAHLGSHYFDMAVQLLGRPTEAHVLAVSDYAPGIDSRFSAVTRLEGGALLTAVGTAQSTSQRTRFVVEDGRRRLEITEEATRITAPDGETIAYERAQSPAELRAEMYRLWLNAWRSGADLGMASLARSRGVTEILERVGQAAVASR